MTDSVLIVGHGSRDLNGNIEIEQFVDRLRIEQPDWRIELCFIEFADILIAEGLARAAQDAQRVIVVPLILNAAGHVKMEIPAHIEHARTQFPHCEFVYAPQLSACDEILNILKRNLKKGLQALDMPDPTTTGVVLLGRGASDRQANGEVAKMARWLQEDSRHERVDIAFTGITYPRLEKVIQSQIQLGMMQVVVLPYYLFTGTLMARIKRQVARLRLQYPNVHFYCGDYFGFEPEIFELVGKRVTQIDKPQFKMPCDGCKFRQFAQDHGQGHDHSHENIQSH
ncbi:MAG: sirohydrochlorin chelatase [Aestuariibacter sp.]|nr:sirohydrochlorin chelatase [Aestuariibacter sp.]MCP5017451.1 sirohydrochlorin chelatase [Ketobacter sp.]